MADAAPPPEAAIYFQPDGYVPERSQLGGRQVAGHGFLTAFLRTHRGGAIGAADHAHFYPMLAWLTKFGLVVTETAGGEGSDPGV
jgi:hypothetical protein